MNSRLFSSPNDASANLPDEMLIQILQELRARELTTISHVCNDAYQITLDNHLWIHRYRRDFGPLVTTEQAKVQYIAAYLLDLANKTPRADQAQLIYLQLFDFIYRYPGQAWALYYMGHLYYEGKGRKLDQDNGLVYLRLSAKNKDHKAICSLINILKTQVDINRQTHLLQILDLGQCDTFIRLLTQRYQEGYKPAAPVIAYLHLEANNNPAEAMKWYEIAIADGCQEAIAESIALKQDDIDEDNVLVHLNTICNQYNYCPEIAGEALFQIAHFHFDQNENDLANTSLVDACRRGHIAANREFGHILAAIAEGNEMDPTFRLDTLQQAIEYLSVGVKAFDLACTDGLFFCLEAMRKHEFASHDSTTTHFKQLYAAGNSSAAIYLSHPLTLEIDPFNAVHIAWLQASTQANIEKSYFQLCEFASQAQPSAFALCALGILSQFGVLHSSIIERDLKQAQQHLDRAHAIDNQALNTYLATLLSENIANKTMTSFLQQEIVLRADNQHCQTFFGA